MLDNVRARARRFVGAERSLFTLLPCHRAGPCAVPSPGLCAVCGWVSFRSAFAHRWQVAVEAQVAEVAWGRGEGCHILFQTMYSGATDGFDGQTELRAVAALSGGPPVPWWFRDLLLSGRLFQQGALGLGSSRTRIPPLSLSGQFLRSWLLDSTGEAGKRPWAHSPGLAPRVGTLGIISKEHFPIPSLVSDLPAWVGCPSHRCPGLGSEGRSQCCPSSGRNGFVLPVIVVSNVIITILF